MRRTREYYLALGYDNPYRWAHYVDAPFTPLKKPLKDSTLALITTAAPYQPDKGDQGPGALYNAAAKFYTVFSGDTAVDHDTAHQPHRLRPQAHHGRGFRHLVPAAADARVRGPRAASRWPSASTARRPTAASGSTLETDAPEILARCRQDQVDAALLVPT